MNVRLLAVAQQELDEAVSHYKTQSQGLGNAFVLETVAAIDRIRRFPDAERLLRGVTLADRMIEDRR